MERQDYGWRPNEEPECADYVLPAVIESLRSHRHLSRILDLGCGNGHMSIRLAEALGVQVLGVDADAAGVSLAKQQANGARFAALNLSFELVDVESDPKAFVEQFGTFDAVICTEVIEHVFYPRKLIRFAREALAPNGSFVLSTPYHGYLKNLAISLLGRWDAHADPLWDGGHIKFWSQSTITRLLHEEGLSVGDFRGVGRIPLLWKSMIVNATPCAHV